MLEALLRSRHAVCLVVTQPDKPRGRGRMPWAPPVKELARSRGVPVIQPESINRPEAVASLRAAAPDAIVVDRVREAPGAARARAAAARLLQRARLAPAEIPRRRADRARDPAAANRRPASRSSAWRPNWTPAPILAQRALKIGDEETAGELSARLSALAAEMIAPLLDAVESGAAVEQPQDAARATEAPSLREERRPGSLAP